jgi:hypothetical protein
VLDPDTGSRRVVGKPGFSAAAANRPPPCLRRHLDSHPEPTPSVRCPTPQPRPPRAAHPPQPPGASPSGSAGRAALPDGTYAGRLAVGSLALVVRDGRVVAYLCDGRRTEAWLTGRADAEHVRLTGADHARLEATVSAGHLRGSVRVQGRTRHFDVGRVHAPAGLYRTAVTCGAFASSPAGWSCRTAARSALPRRRRAPRRLRR